MKKIITLLLQYKYILILLILTFFAVKPLLHPGFPPTHDGENHVIRFYLFDKALRDGDIYPRWASDLNKGYGIPLFNYVYPLPNYFGSLFHLFGASFIDSFKISLLAGTFIGVVFLYLWTRLFLVELAAFTAGVFYAFSPYRFVDIYVRGSVGEIWALAWFPAFLWAITHLLEKQKIRYAILSSIFLAAIIFSHNILALMCIIFGLSYTVFLLKAHKWEKRLIVISVCVFLLGLSLSAIFWLPALLETRYVQGLQIYDLDPNFPELYQLLIPSWGTGFSGGKLDNQMSFQIGVANLLAVLISIILLIKNRKKKTIIKELLLFFLGWFVLVTYLMLSFSKPIWHTIPLLEYFQFPWRLLSLVIVICSFIAGAVVHIISKGKKQFMIAAFFVITAVVLTISYTKPAYYHDRTDKYYLTRSNFIHGTNSPGDVFNTIWMNKKLPLKNKIVESIQGKAKITKEEVTISTIHFHEKSASDVKFIVNVAYFPGWTLLVDGRKKSLERTKDGIMAFSLAKGKHVVGLSFNDTIVRRVGTSFSLLGLIICIGLGMVGKKLIGRKS
jgi:uncharacterized membrane protein